jgi:type VI secretion system secreted protein VgrG
MNDFADIAGFADTIGRSRIAERGESRLHQHVAIFLADGRVLSDETFRLVHIEGQEQINQPFEFRLELHANTQDKSRAPLITFDQLLSRPVTACIDLPTPGVTPDKGGVRFARALKGGSEDGLSLWNGIVADFSMGVPGVYHLTLRPALWTLSLTNRYCVHRQLSIRGVIESVLRDHGITVETEDKPLRNSASLSAISGADNPAVTRVQDWLQAGESDLEFLTRVASRAHVYFYFEHHATNHRVIFANRPAFTDALPDGRKLRYAQTSIDELGLEQDDLVFDYRYTQSMTATGVDGFLVREGAAWEQDPIAQFETYHARAPAQLGSLPFRRLQIVQYGGSDSEVRWDTQTSDRARNTAAVSLSGSSTCALLRSGNCFTLDHADVADVNPRAIRPTLADERMVVTKVSHDSSLDGTYRNQFEATAADGQVAGFSLADTQQGLLLARVVKHDNGEYPQDWRYYQRNAFDPEQDKLRDTTANPQVLRAKGVYVRLATDAPDVDPTWIKLSASMNTVPELGVTVLVTRAQDNSELPEIQNIIEANGRLVVKPSGWTASTNVGSGYSTNYGDGCAVHFGQNSPGDLPTARNWVDGKYQNGNSTQPGWFSGVHFRDVSWSQGGSSSYSRAENGRDDVLSESISLGSTYNVQEGKESKNRSTLDYSYSEQTVGSSDNYSTVTGRAYSNNNINEQVNESTIVTDTSTTNITTQTSNTTIGTQNSTSNIGSENSAATVGSSNSARTTGTSVNAQINGVSFNTSLTGVSTSMETTGVSAHVQAVGSSNNVSATGASANLSYTGAALEMSSTGARTSVSNIGFILDVTDYGGGVRSDNAAAVLRSDLTGLESKIVSILKVIL